MLSVHIQPAIPQQPGFLYKKKTISHKIIFQESRDTQTETEDSSSEEDEFFYSSSQHLLPGPLEREE